MRKNELPKILKSKGFYLSLLTGVVAIFALCFVYMNSMNQKDQNKNLTDLNNQAVKNEQQQKAVNTDKDKVANQQQAKANTDKKESTANTDKKTTTQVKENPLLENDITAEKDEHGVVKNVDESKKAATTGKSSSAVAKSEEDKSVAVIQQPDKAKSKLSFNEEEGLSWPVEGNIIMNYSMDKGVYFATLGNYKCNDALIIDAKEGTKVKNAAKGKVVSVEKNEETGTTVTLDIGDGYSLVYGQLKNLSVKKGETVKEGGVIGVIAKPTKYYSVEGANLYFKVIQDEQPVNPMYLLK